MTRPSIPEETPVERIDAAPYAGGDRIAPLSLPAVWSATLRRALSFWREMLRSTIDLVDLALFATIWTVNDRWDRRSWEESRFASRRRPDPQPRRRPRSRQPAYPIRSRRHPTTDRKSDLTT
jgi:hypothetical protein